MTISLEFHGAARQVTGSRHLLQVGDRRVLIECGMVQGPRKLSDQANREFGFDPRSIDAVILSHAHIDHCGSLPRLVKLGFGGQIHCTRGTESLAAVLLADSAHIQAYDARYLDKHGHRFEPPYDIDDVARTVRLMRGVDYDQEVEVCRGVRARFIDAGHILGSAMVIIDVSDGGTDKRIAFTGDHGRRDMPLLRAPQRLPASDYLITESTYGDRLHGGNTDIEAELERVVLEEQRDGGRILIPAFSVGRTQNVLFFLGNLIRAGRIPKLPVFVDSPLATEATKIMSAHADVLDRATHAILNDGDHPLFFDGVRYVASVDESKSLNGLRSGIIIAASGMCEAGRILHHLKQSLSRPEDCVLIVGYQAAATLGRRLLDGQEHVKVFGHGYDVRCKVRSMPGLSAHADYAEMLENTGHLADSVECAFVVHGEEAAALAYAERLRDRGFRRVEVPEQGQRFSLPG